MHTNVYKNKAKAISAELLLWNLKKRDETERNGKKQEEMKKKKTVRNGNKR